MTKVIVAGMTAAVLMLFVGASASATPITVSFYVEIGSIGVSDDPPDPYYFDPVAALAQVPSRGSVGDRLFGSVTYDDARIPQVGPYSVGLDDPWIPPYPPGSVDELQLWDMNWGGLTPLGFLSHDPWYLHPRLEFADGRPVGIYDGYHSNLDPGMENEIFDGTDVTAWGRFLWNAEDSDLGSVPVVSSYRVRGTVHFPVPDLGSSLVLFSMALAGLGTWRNHWR